MAAIGDLTGGCGVAVDTSSTQRIIFIIADPSQQPRVGLGTTQHRSPTGSPQIWLSANPICFTTTAIGAVIPQNATASICASQPASRWTPAATSTLPTTTNNRVLEYNAPYAAYAGSAIPALQRLHARTNCPPTWCSGNSAAVFRLHHHRMQPEPGRTARPPTTGCADPEGVSVNPTTGDLYVADSINSRVLMYLNPLAAGGGKHGTSGFAGDETADYVFGQTSFTAKLQSGVERADGQHSLWSDVLRCGGGGVGVDSRRQCVHRGYPQQPRAPIQHAALDGVTPVTSTSFSANGCFRTRRRLYHQQRQSGRPNPWVPSRWMRSDRCQG